MSKRSQRRNHGALTAPHSGIQKAAWRQVRGHGSHNCIQMLDELRAGFDGYVPIITYADLLQTVFELWNEGKQKEAFDMFGRVQAFQTITKRRSTS